MLKIYNKLDFLKNKINDYNTIYRDIFPSSASFIISNHCNLSCSYCFEKNKTYGKMTSDVVKDSILFLYNNAKITNNSIDITLFGGEPCLNPNIIEDVFCELSRLNYNKTHVSIITNSSFLPLKVERLFYQFKQKFNLSVQLSIDGPDYIHNIHRIRKNNKGSFNTTLMAYNKWKKIFNTDMSNLNLHSCISDETIFYMFDIYKYFIEELEATSVWFLPILFYNNWTEKHLEIYEEQLDKIFNYINSHKNKNILFRDFITFSRCKQKQTKKWCGAGYSYITISPTGLIYPCHQFYYNDIYDEFCIGNIWKGIDQDKTRIFNYLEKKDMDIFCAKECQNSCYMCIASLYDQYKTLLVSMKNSIYCKFMSIDYRFQLKTKQILENI